MKLRTTTPASISIIAKRGIALLSVAFVLAAGFWYVQSQPASADQYDDKIRALQQDMARYQAEADRLNAESVTLSNALAQLTNEKNALQTQINLSQAQYDQLVIKIAETEKQIADNQDALGNTLADLYVDDSVSPIEMLASSQSIGDFLNKQEYRNSVKDELNTTIKRVKTLKADLSNQKQEVEKVLAEQKTARDNLAAKESEQASLLAQTQNDEANYQNLIKDSEAQIAEARATQAVLRARTASTGGYSLVDAGSLTAYPWNESNCPMWGYLSTGGSNGSGGDGRGYGCRQCASYAAWKIARETGIYYRWGNGGDFARNAIANGYQNLGSNPQPGSIAVILGTPGHVAWVEAVAGDQVLVSQYNYNYGAGWGMYSEMWLSKNFFDQYVKIV
ncbi:CHAP domain-containing protein [Candidatus Saccharibacteria bacterium]|nr:CHAP domain-containing protein [Candidatus Saccharibacteria bacterium]